MRDRATSGPLKTTGTEQWPIRMCQWIAAMLLDTCTPAATTATRGKPLTSYKKKRIATQSVNRKAPDSKGVKARLGAMRRYLAKDFHDGGGLKEARKLGYGASWYWLRRELKRAILQFVGSEKKLEREAFCMASGEALEMTGYRRSYWNRFATGYKLRIWERRTFARSLRGNRCDWNCYGRYSKLRVTLIESSSEMHTRGYEWGIRYPLPRTPHVFEEQLRWPLDNPPWEPGLRWVPNYSSVEEHADFAKAKFEEDIAERMMIKMSLHDFKARYGEHRAIAALAGIVEDEAIGKKRMIHDMVFGLITGCAAATRYGHPVLGRRSSYCEK